MLESGGNAIDAGVAAGFALALLKPQSVGIGGEVPILIHLADKQGRSRGINGQGWAPRAARIDWFTPARHRPDSVGWLPARDRARPVRRVVHRPAASSAPIAAGRPRPVGRAGRAAASPMYTALRNADRSRSPSASPPSGRPRRRSICRDGSRPREGELLRNPDWARTMKGAIDASLARCQREPRGADPGRDRLLLLRSCRRSAPSSSRRSNAFRDDSGEAHTGLLTLEDFADFGARGTQLEDPLRITYHGVEVLKCGPWSQGPVMLQHLRLLEGFDLHCARPQHAPTTCTSTSRRPNSPSPTASATTATPSSPASRSACCSPRTTRPSAASSSTSGRPASSQRPGAVAAAQASARRAAGRSSPGHHPRRRRRPLGQPLLGDAQRRLDRLVTRGRGPRLPARHARPDVLPRPASTPNSLVPGKRPRTTLSPSMALRDGEPWMAFGTPGGDQQDQWSLQFFLNVVDFGMDLQEALDAPTVQSTHFPGSFYPHGVRARRRARGIAHPRSRPRRACQPRPPDRPSTARGATAR